MALYFLPPIFDPLFVPFVWSPFWAPPPALWKTQVLLCHFTRPCYPVVLQASVTNIQLLLSIWEESLLLRIFGRPATPPCWCQRWNWEFQAGARHTGTLQACWQAAIQFGWVACQPKVGASNAWQYFQPVFTKSYKICRTFYTKLLLFF